MNSAATRPVRLFAVDVMRNDKTDGNGMGIDEMKCAPGVPLAVGLTRQRRAVEPPGIGQGALAPRAAHRRPGQL